MAGMGLAECAAEGAGGGPAGVEGDSLQSDAGKVARQGKRQAPRQALGRRIRTLDLIEEAQHRLGRVRPLGIRVRPARAPA